jgi:hypothetical protein
MVTEVDEERQVIILLPRHHASMALNADEKKDANSLPGEVEMCISSLIESGRISDDHDAEGRN